MPVDGYHPNLSSPHARRGLAKEAPVAVAEMESSGALQDNRRIIFHFFIMPRIAHRVVGLFSDFQMLMSLWSYGQTINRTAE